ncbi:MAG: hypothetical protein FWC51_01055 [Proteobacteria bacterium]|nr:hypothetical protein [Pseudomonadota bacterium]
MAKIHASEQEVKNANIINKITLRATSYSYEHVTNEPDFEQTLECGRTVCPFGEGCKIAGSLVIYMPAENSQSIELTKVFPGCAAVQLIEKSVAHKVLTLTNGHYSTDSKDSEIPDIRIVKSGDKATIAYSAPRAGKPDKEVEMKLGIKDAIISQLGDKSITY